MRFLKNVFFVFCLFFNSDFLKKHYFIFFIFVNTVMVINGINLKMVELGFFFLLLLIFFVTLYFYWILLNSPSFFS